MICVCAFCFKVALSRQLIGNQCEGLHKLSFKVFHFGLVREAEPCGKSRHCTALPKCGWCQVAWDKVSKQPQFSTTQYIKRHSKLQPGKK